MSHYGEWVRHEVSYGTYVAPPVFLPMVVPPEPDPTEGTVFDRRPYEEALALMSRLMDHASCVSPAAAAWPPATG